MSPFEPFHPIDAALDARAGAGVQLGRLQAMSDVLFEKRPCDVDGSDAAFLQRLAEKLRDLCDEMAGDLRTSGKQ